MTLLFGKHFNLVPPEAIPGNMPAGWVAGDEINLSWLGLASKFFRENAGALGYEGLKSWITSTLDAIRAAETTAREVFERQTKTDTRLEHAAYAKAVMPVDGARRIKVIVSSGKLDRDGDILNVAGIDLVGYKQNPVVLFQHRGDCPIAKCVSVQVIGGKLIAEAEFPEMGMVEKSDEVYNLIKAGVLNAVSIGFRPIPGEWEWLDQENPWSGRKFNKSEMLEFSIVSIPSNTDAMIISREIGVEGVKSAKGVIIEAEPSTEGVILDEKASPEGVGAGGEGVGAGAGAGGEGEKILIEAACVLVPDADKKKAEQRRRQVVVRRYKDFLTEGTR